MAEKNYIVTAATVTIEVSGELRYLYQGAPVPTKGVDEEHVKALLDIGLISEAKVVEVDGDEVVVPEGDPVEAWTIPVLKRYAEIHQIDLGKATSKGDIFALVKPTPVKTDENGNPAGTGKPAESVPATTEKTATTTPPVK